MQYKDAKKAIEWLCATFGFEKHLVVPGEGNTIAHAELTFNSGMIMLGSTKDNAYSRLIKQPFDVGGANTQTPYIIVEEVDNHYHQAMQSGAEIVIDLKEEDYGGKTYTCRDFEGFILDVRFV